VASVNCCIVEFYCISCTWERIEVTGGRCRYNRLRKVKLDDDGLSQLTTLGFNFPWMGKMYNRFRLSANGYVQLFNEPHGRALKDEPVKCCNGLRGSNELMGSNRSSSWRSTAPLVGTTIAFYYTDLDPSLRMPGSCGSTFTKSNQSGQLTFALNPMVHVVCT